MMKEKFMEAIAKALTSYISLYPQPFAYELNLLLLVFNILPIGPLNVSDK